MTRRPTTAARQRTEQAMATWTDEDWAGRARMARARLAAGRRLEIIGISDDGIYGRVFRWATDGVLDDLDREALDRAGTVPP
jgi:hypothetical protein